MSQPHGRFAKMPFERDDALNSAEGNGFRPNAQSVYQLLLDLSAA